MIEANVAMILVLFGLFEADIGCDWTITSTHRSVEHNKEVGGVPNSKHLNGLAIDAVPLCSLDEHTVRRISLKWFDRAFYYKSTGHWHFDVKEEDNENN